MAAELEILQSPRYLAGSLGDLETLVYRDGTLTDPASAGTVTVVDEDGNTLSSGAATVVGSSSGTLRYTPTAAAMAQVNLLTITWASVVLGTDPAITLTTYGEVVGDMLFTEAGARAFDNAALGNATTYPDSAIRFAHDRIHDAFEGILRFPLGRRYFRETLDGEGTSKLRLDNRWIRTIRKVQTRTPGTATWTDFTADELAATQATRWGQVVREDTGVFPEGVQNVRISYEAGAPIDGDLRLAALMVLRNQLVPSNVSDRALFQTNELGQFRMAVADATQPGRWFGLPTVDAILGRLQETVVR